MKSYIDEVKRVLDEIDLSKIDRIADYLLTIKKFDQTVYLCGNGGANCDVLHFGQDLFSYLINKGIEPIKSHILGNNSGLSTALSNDFGYKDALRLELAHYIQKDKGEILFCMSGSGNSENIITAVEWASQYNTIIISFTGFDGGKLKKLSDPALSIHINSDKWGIIHSISSLLFHMILDRYIEICNII